MNVPLKRFFATVILCIHIMLWHGVSFADNTILDEYRNSRDRLDLIQQRTHAVQIIAQAQDPEVLKEALEDVLKFSSTQEENQDALHQVNVALAKITNKGTDRQKVMLYKGKILRRLGLMEEGNAIFEQAYKEKWPQYQYENERSLLERSDFAGAALQEYDRVSGRMYGDYYQVPPYKEGIEDLGLFKLYLGRLKEDKPDPGIIDEVIAKLDEQSEPLLLKEMAKALCFSQYKRFSEAWEIVTKVESNLELYGETSARKDISLYKSMILLDEGKNIPAAQTEFRKFMEAHGDDYKVIYSGGVRFGRSLEKTPENIAKTDEIVILLIESPIIQDEEVKKTFSDYDIAHLYDLYQMGLGYSGKYFEASEVNKYVYANYFPSLPAANCAIHYASYLTWANGGDLDAAMDILDAVATRAPFDAIMPFVKVSQAEICLNKGMRIQALGYVQEAITRSIINDGGTLETGLKKALSLQKRILENK